jgi:pyruvate kinase
MKKTKILATFGPAIASEERIRKLVDQGVNAFRINCSHGTTEDFIQAARLIRKGSRTAQFPVGLLFDISGPKLRLSRFEGQVEIEQGQTIYLTKGKTDLEHNTIGVNHPRIIDSIHKGERVFIDDGDILLDVVSTGDDRVKLKAANPGTLLPSKGINLPDSDITIPTISEKDRRDIKTAVEQQADFVALSFVRSPDDIKQARRLIAKNNGDQQLIAKLEKREAIDALEEIMDISDGVMVARGDLGVELPQEDLPKLQKRIIALAAAHRKPVIVATQMLESMRFSPRATRAEVNDVATAVFDHADSVMLSAETATGKYPEKAVATMHDVIVATEQAAIAKAVDINKMEIESPIPVAIAGAVSGTERYMDTAAIFAFTTSGFTAGLISSLAPTQPIIALTPDERVMNRLSLRRSVFPVRIKQPDSFQEMLDTVRSVCEQHHLAKKGQRIIITGGAPFGSNVPTNVMMYQEVE